MGLFANRHIITASGCPVCMVGCEDIMRAMFTCLRAKKMWEKLGVQSVSEEATSLDIAGVVAKRA
jgi:hydrogenase maturation factor